MNVKEAMTKDDFIQQQNIAYLDQKHKKKELTTTQKPNHFSLVLGFASFKLRILS